MFKRLLFTFYLLCVGALSAPAAVREFRLDQDRLWLRVEDEPLSKLLEQFTGAGIRVQLDPAAQKTVTGIWQNSEVESALRVLLSPHNYVLSWQREQGPLGELTRLTGIRVFRAGHGDAARPLRPVRRIETSLDGSLRFVARELLVAFGPDSSVDDLRALLARVGGTVIATQAELGVYRILLPAGANVLALLEELHRDQQIAWVEPNYIYDVPPRMPVEVAERVDPSGSVAGEGWTAPTGDRPVSVAVLDSGLLLSDRLQSAVLSSFDATRPDVPLQSDAVGHGTLMAKLAAGLLDPYGSSAGEGVPVVAIKAFADDGSADAFTLMSAMTYATEHSAGPISLSWGSETSSVFLEAAMQRALDRGSLIFAAVGNEPSGTPMYPAAYPGVLGVAASNGDRLASYSNRGDFVDFVVPGSAGGAQGTSVATAALAHIAAKYQRIHPEATAQEVVRALNDAADSEGFLRTDAIARLLTR